MFLRLWNYLRGYVMIEVTGFSVERFMNLAVHKGIYIWDVNKKGSGVTMKVSVKGFKMLKSCSKKTKCRVKILKKLGSPFIIYKYSKRKFYVTGVVFFILILYALSSFIWLIEIEGTERIQKEKILEYCKNYGLYAGSLKFKINKHDIEQNIINDFSDLSWFTIQIKGTKATLKLTETVPKVEIIDKTTPCDVVALKDGIITEIITVSGTPKVKMKDVVQKGDILVSSEIIAKNDETGIIKEYTHAQAEVKAKLWEEINFSVPLSYAEKQFTENKMNDYSFIVLGRPVNIYRPEIKFHNYDKKTFEKQLQVGDNYVLPIVLVTERYEEFNTVLKTRTAEEAAELAEKIITNRIIREFDFESDIMDKQVEFTELKEHLLVRAVITVIERIDTQALIFHTDDGSNVNEPAEQPTDTQ